VDPGQDDNGAAILPNDMRIVGRMFGGAGISGPTIRLGHGGAPEADIGGEEGVEAGSE